MTRRRSKRLRRSRGASSCLMSQSQCLHPLPAQAPPQTPLPPAGRPTAPPRRGPLVGPQDPGPSTQPAWSRRPSCPKGQMDTLDSGTPEIAQRPHSVRAIRVPPGDAASRRRGGRAVLGPSKPGPSWSPDRAARTPETQRPAGSSLPLWQQDRVQTRTGDQKNRPGKEDKIRTRKEDEELGKRSGSEKKDKARRRSTR